MDKKDWIVTVIDKEYEPIYANDRYGACSQGVRLYQREHPELSFTYLMHMVRASQLHPKTPGRKRTNYEVTSQKETNG